MENRLPPSPFATRLSGSAKETELRMRSIFQWKKLRPPLPLVVLTLAAGLLCFNLVSCQAGRQDVAVVMDVQYYDTAENYIEIPALVVSGGAQPDGGVTAINQELSRLKESYQPVLDGTAEWPDNRCVLYPTETDRYLSLLFFREEFKTDLDTAHLTCVVYDRKEGAQVTLTDALALAGQTEEVLYQALEEQYAPQLEQLAQETEMAQYGVIPHFQDQALEAFRMGADGQPIFYLTASIDTDEFISGSSNIYIWQGGSFSLYDQHTLEPEPLVPEEECMELDPPLWHRWYFAGTAPEGGFADPAVNSEAPIWTALRSQADLFALDDRDGLTYTRLASISGEGYTLAALSIQDYYPHYSLIIGAADDRTGELLGPVFETGAYGALPQCVSITRYDGAPALLYTANGMHQAISWGQAGLVGVDGGGLSWAWPVEGDLREEGSQARADYDTYWEDHLALMAPGGVDVFVQRSGTPEDVLSGNGHQWAPDHNELFCRAPETQLPMPVYYQTRVWLEEFTRNEHNPWDAHNVSAAWQIVSLAPADGVYHDRNYEGEAVYDLTARADNGNDLWFTASLLFDHGAGKVAQVQSFAMGSRAELGLADSLSDGPGAFEGNFSDRDQLILDALQTQYPTDRIYFLGEEPGAPREHDDLRIDSVTYAGETPLPETVGVAYLLTTSRYYNYRQSADDPGVLDWYPSSSEYIILSRSSDGAFQGVLGIPNFNTDGMAVKDVIQQVAWGLLDLEVCLFRDGYPTPVGPGNWPDLFDSARDGEPAIEVLDGWEPTYNPGDYWDRWGVDGFTARRYYNAAEDRRSANTVDITRSDFSTPRGIRVGDSRETVLEAYSEARVNNYWGDYPDDPPLCWYAWPEMDIGPDTLGPAILFFFEGDTLRQITLTNMFD